MGDQMAEVAKSKGPPARGVLAGMRQDRQNEKLGVQPQAGHAWSHGFLNKKFWHPSNFRNQQSLFIAEQASAAQQKRNEEASKEFAANEEFFKNTELLNHEDKTKLRNKAALAFMYQKPPGYDAMIEREAKEAAEKEANEAEARKKQWEGVDDDTSDGCRLVADVGLVKTSSSGGGEKKHQPHTFKRDMYGNKVATAADFPELKGAPKQAGVKDATRVQPFGKLIRAVQCLRCGLLGHASGDRECAMFHVNPNDVFRSALEDPMAMIRAREALSNGHTKWEMTRPSTAGRSPPRGGHAADAPNQQLVLLDYFEGGGGAADGDDVGVLTNVLQSLPKAERRRLIKEYEKVEREKKREAKRIKVAAAEEYLRVWNMNNGAHVAIGDEIENKDTGEKEQKRKHLRRNKKRKRDKKQRVGGE